MADVSGPFDSVQWSEAQWYRFAAMWAPSGVVGPSANSVGTGGLAWSSSGLTVTLGAGRAWVRGGGREVGTTVSKTATTNTNSNPRRDRIVLRRDLATHTIEPVIIAGTPAASPVAPAITQTEGGTWDLPLFSFQVPGSSGTTLSNVVDERAWIDPTIEGVTVYSQAARDANFPAPQQGQVVFRGDTGDTETYYGSTWERLAGPVVQGKMWRISGASSTLVANAPTTVDFTTARVGGGMTFDNAGNTLTVPRSGFYDLRARGYITGSANYDASFRIVRARSATSDLEIVLSARGRKIDANDEVVYATDVLPLAAGDKLYLRAYYSAGGQYYGIDETTGVYLSATFIGPLTGATPV